MNSGEWALLVSEQDRKSFGEKKQRAWWIPVVELRFVAHAEGCIFEP